MQATCAADADSVNAFTTWLLPRGLTEDAARWLASLPASLGEQPLVKLARADCCIAQ